MRVQRRVGFTLVELLVVIAIIGILVALLLPAIQAAREAARRSQCGNNVKQLGVALQNYHDTYKAYPIGARMGGVANTWGTSFYVGLLPFVEQRELFDSWPWGSTDGYANGNTGLRGGVNINSANGPSVDVTSIKIPAFRCPSSALPEFNGATNAYMASYAGIMGAVDNQGVFVEARQRACCTCCGGTAANGVESGGGMLLLNQSSQMRDCTDGTSNCMILGESSGWLFNGTTQMHGDPSWPHGWPMGTGRSYQITGGGASDDARPFNLTSIRYPIGTRNYVLPGVYDNHGANNPLVSEHPGGAIVGLVDSSTRFMSNDTDLLLLKFLATRDDGNPLGEF